MWSNFQFLESKWVKELKDHLEETAINDFSSIDAMENELLFYYGSPTCHVRLVNSGTSALLTALYVVKRKAPTKVLGPAYGYPIGINAARMCDFHPIVGDIKKDTLCLDPEVVYNAAKEEKISVVVFVNHAGYIGEDLLKIKDICDEYRIDLIEDSCHALGNEYKGWKAGKVGDIATLSFAQNKIIKTGEGGAVIVNKETIGDLIDDFIYHGGWHNPNVPIEDKYLNLGLNLRIPPQNAYLAFIQFQELDSLIEEKRAKFELFQNLHNFELDKGVPSNFIHLAKKPTQLAKRLKKFNIPHEHKINYRPMHWYVEQYQYCKVAEEIFEKAFYFPENTYKVINPFIGED